MDLIILGSLVSEWVREKERKKNEGTKKNWWQKQKKPILKSTKLQRDDIGGFEGIYRCWMICVNWYVGNQYLCMWCVNSIELGLCEGYANDEDDEN